jgi:diadenosine tetraphosphate (Ap4A) HIT family hydrolase
MNTVVKKLMPRCWRTEAMHKKYENERVIVLEDGGCPMCTAPTRTAYIHWRVVENIYPYDAVAEKHDMLVTKRHLSNDTELTSEEQEELSRLKATYLNDSYTFILEALPKSKSIPGHYHLHLIIPKVVT